MDKKNDMQANLEDESASFVRHNTNTPARHEYQVSSITKDQDAAVDLLEHLNHQALEHIVRTPGRAGDSRSISWKVLILQKKAVFHTEAGRPMFPSIP
eukprot:766544-Hanusia_phi.AAC.2